MIEALKEEEIVNKVGGRFKLSTLIQKRLVALNSGARAAGRASTPAWTRWKWWCKRSCRTRSTSIRLGRGPHHGRTGLTPPRRSISTSIASEQARWR